MSIDDVRRVASRLPLSYDAVVRGRVKFRVGRIVYLAFNRDGTVMGFAHPKEERDWLIGGDPLTSSSFHHLGTSATTGPRSAWPRSTSAR